MTWLSTGGPEPAGPRHPAAAAALGTAAVVVRSVGDGEALVVAVAAAAACGLALWASTRAPRRRFGRGPAAVVALCATAAALALVGLGPTATMAASSVVWARIIGVQVRPDWPRHARAAAPAIAPAAAAAVAFAAGAAWWLGWLLLGVAGLVIWVSSVHERAAGRVVALAERVGGAIAAVVRTVLMVPVAFFLSILWACQRIVRFDPLEPPTGAATRWVERDNPDRWPDRLYAHVRAADVDRTSVKVRRVAFRATAAVVIVVLAVGGLLRLVGPAELPPLELAANAQAVVEVGHASDVIGEDPDWAEVVTEHNVFVRHPRFDPVTTFSYEDLSGRWLNVSDGVRSTWRPPPCECRRLRVWVFGGSTAFGFPQKDDHSIPSELARVAWERGLALDIENRAMPGFSSGQEARQFADLLVSSDPPYVAVFLDGANDVTQQQQRAVAGGGRDESDTIEATAERRVEAAFSVNDVVEGVDRLAGWGRESAAAGEEPIPPPREIGEHAGNRYRRNAELVSRLAASAGVAVVRFWQPTAADVGPELAAPGVLTGASREVMSTTYAGAFSRVPDDVVDLRNVLDAAPRPVFLDVTHVSDTGASIIGRKMFEHMEPLLTELARP